MLKIGDFSKLANVTVKTLRHYAELGLLKPAWIDRFTGYRYYSLDQLPRLNRILALKDLGLSLEQVQRVLNSNLTAEELRGMLHIKQAELQQMLQSEGMRLARVEARLKQIEREGRLSEEAVVVRGVDPLLVAYVPLTVLTLADLAERRAAAQRELENWLRRMEIDPPGPWMLIYPAGEYLEKDIPLEIAVGLAEPPRELPRYNQRVMVRMLAGLPLAAVYAQAFEGGEVVSYEAQTLYAWVEANGYRACGPAREVYWSDQNPPETERSLWQPVLPKPTFAVEIILPVEPIAFSSADKETMMEPKIIEREGFLAAGPVYEGNNANQEIAVLWAEQFMPNVDRIKHVTGDILSYGICYMDAGLPDGQFRYVAAVEIDKPEDAPPEFYQAYVPGGKYAVFKHKGSLESLHNTYETIYQTWLPQSGYKRADRPDLEVYTHEFHDFEPDSLLELWVPIE